MDELRNKRVTVLGLGRLGGGIAVARWLCEQGARVVVTDREDASKLADSVRQLDGLPIEFRLGEAQQRESDFTGADLVVTSPAVKPTHPLLLAAAAAGVAVTTEVCLFVERCPGRVYGVTGTKGKSTTTALLGKMLSAVGPCYVGGNIGGSLLSRLGEMDEQSTVVLELSSYMLHWLGLAKWSPHVAVLTMLGLDHVEWHGDASAYLDAKRNIVRHQPPGGRLVRRDDALSRTFVAPEGVDVLTYPAALPAFDLKLPGEHNQHNAQAAFLAAESAALDFESARRAVADFTGLPHRLQLVHESGGPGGVRWYNDSIATIPEAAVIACDAFPPDTVIQIVGGSRKAGLSWDAMGAHLGERCRRVLTIGEMGPHLVERCGGRAEPVETLEAAVARAAAIARPATSFCSRLARPATTSS
jgi:UDP-N-acetylmuramoylalanine--D-glutamate ligase